MALKGDEIFKEKSSAGLKNFIRNLVNFYAISRNFEHF